jgi:hypothetical protein
MVPRRLKPPERHQASNPPLSTPDLSMAYSMTGDHVGGVELVFITENAPAPPLLDALHRTGIFGNLYIRSQ